MKNSKAGNTPEVKKPALKIKSSRKGSARILKPCPVMVW
jgi:hypothetical protein